MPRSAQDPVEGWRAALQVALFGSLGVETEKIPWHAFVLRSLLRGLPTAWVGLALAGSSAPLDLLQSMLTCLLIGWGLHLYQVVSPALSRPSLAMLVALFAGIGVTSLDLWRQLQAGAGVDGLELLLVAGSGAALMGVLLVVDGARRQRTAFPIACALWLLIGMGLGLAAGSRLLGLGVGLGIPVCLTLGEWAERWALGGRPTRPGARARHLWLVSLLLGLLLAPCMPAATFLSGWSEIRKTAPEAALYKLWEAQQRHREKHGRYAQDLEELITSGEAAALMYGAPLRGYRFETRPDGVCLAWGPELWLAEDATGSGRWLPALPDDLAPELVHAPQRWPKRQTVPALPSAFQDWATRAGHDALAAWAWWQACWVLAASLAWQVLLALFAGLVFGLGWVMTRQLQRDSAGD